MPSACLHRRVLPALAGCALTALIDGTSCMLGATPPGAIPPGTPPGVMAPGMRGPWGNQAWAATGPDRLLQIFREGLPSTWDEAMATLSEQQVVLLGEQHDDPATHELELETLKALHRTARPVVLSLEMFETDVQAALDAYLAGKTTEAEFMAATRPWKNYRTDYRPLIEYAKARGIPVVAANVPRRLAARVAKEGIATLRDLPAADRAWVAIPDSCPEGRPWERFRATSLEHPGVTPESAWRMYEAQCLKDATMARSIAGVLSGRSREPVVLHINGSFHSDFGEGVPAMLRRQLPGIRLGILTVRPTDSVPVSLPVDLAGAADFTAFVMAPPPSPAPSPPPSPATPPPSPATMLRSPARMPFSG